MVNIRDMEVSDIDRVMEIEAVTFIAPWKKEEMLYEFNENKYANMAVITIEDKVIGFYDYWHTFDSASIAQIAVDPLYQKQGLGSLLMEEIVKECYAKKVRTITLEVRKNNEKAVKLYKKFGFKTVVTKEKYYSNGDDALYMVRECEIHG